MKVYVVCSQWNACDAGEETESVAKVFYKEEDAKEYCAKENGKRESVYSTSYSYEGFEVE